MRFKLTAQHYIDDRLLEAGEIIGEGTSVPFLMPDGTPRPPSTEMEGLDEESQAAVDAVQARSFPLFLDLNPAMGMDPTAVEVDPTNAQQMASLTLPKPGKVK